MGDDAVSRLAASITQLTLCQVSTDEIDAAIKLLDKACQKLRGIPDVPPQKIRLPSEASSRLKHRTAIARTSTANSMNFSKLTT